MELLEIVNQITSNDVETKNEFDLFLRNTNISNEDRTKIINFINKFIEKKNSENGNQN